MSRKKIKDSKKADCSYKGCKKRDSFKKRLGVYFKGNYYCSKNCIRKEKEDAKSSDNK